MAYKTVATKVKNAKTQAYYNESGDLLSYIISPKEGYVLHDNKYDIEDENGEIKEGYIPYPSSVTVWHNYDFEANERQLYTAAVDTVPTEQIF